MNGKVIQSRLDAFRGPPSFFHMGRHAVEPIGCLKQFAADIVRLCSPGKSPDFAGLLSVKRAVCLWIVSHIRLAPAKGYSRPEYLPSTVKVWNPFPADTLATLQRGSEFPGLRQRAWPVSYPPHGRS